MGRQFGSSSDDLTAGPVVDSQGSVYLGGFTYGSLFGPNQGNQDAWVAKYDAEGNFVWGQQFGSSGYDFVNATCIGPDDHVYVTGSTWPLFDSNGSGGALVAEFASDGTLVRSIQFGTGVFGTADNDGMACAVTADSMVYVAGATLSVHGSNGFITKLTPITAP